MPFMKTTALICIPVLLLLLGCGDSPGLRQEMKDPALGLVMYAPPGWKVARDLPTMCTKGDFSGVILSEPLEGKDFAEYVGTLSKAHNADVISLTPTTIGDCRAFEAVIAYPALGTKAMKVYIHKADTLIEVSFVTLEGDFPRYESDFRQSVDSVRIE